MSYSIEHDTQTDIIDIKLDGQLTLEKVREVASAAVLLAKEKGCFRVLNDMREASIRLTMLEAYSIPSVLAEIASASGTPIYRFRRAELLPDLWPWSQFYETISKNRVQNVTLFRDKEAAKKWLLEK